MAPPVTPPGQGKGRSVDDWLTEGYARAVGLLEGGSAGHVQAMRQAGLDRAQLAARRDQLALVEARCVVSRMQRALLDEVLDPAGG